MSRRIVVHLGATLAICWAALLPAQAPPRSTALREGIAFGSGATLLLLASLLPAPTFPTCGPCPRSEVPGFDRWVIHGERVPIQAVGWVALGSFTVYSWIDLARDSTTGVAHARASMASGLFAAGAATFLKEVFHRRRPAYFTDQVVGQSESSARENLRSFPSGDTSIAFALATSYLLSRGGRVTPAQRIAAIASAAIAAVSRVAGGKHFPSDVLGGAVVGIGGALVVHQILF